MNLLGFCISFIFILSMKAGKGFFVAGLFCFLFYCYLCFFFWCNLTDKFIIFVLFCEFILIGTRAIDCSVEPKNNEGRLRKNLFCGYDKTSRPILTDGAISVKIKMIIKAFEYDHLLSKLTVSSWLAMVSQ